MIKVSVMYPYSEGASFDMNYYRSTHIPLVEELLGDALQSSAVDAGIAGGAPGEPAPFMAMGHLIFESLESFQRAFGPKAKQILADISNYTNVQPVTQISEIQ